MLGSARKVVVTKDETTIIEGAGDAALSRVALLRFAQRSLTLTPTTTVRSCRAPGCSPVVLLC